jgi:ubiquinone biosynthesis protein
MGRDLYPKINIWDVAKPELERIFRERYGVRRTARKVQRELPAWLARGPEVPTLVHEALRFAARGRINARIDSDDLAGIQRHLERHNRRVPGAILSAGLLIASAVLAAYDVGPWLQDYSIPAMVGLAVAGIVGWRALRA